MSEEERIRLLIKQNESEEKEFWDSLITEMADSEWMDKIIDNRIMAYNKDNEKSGREIHDYEYYDSSDFDDSFYIREDESYRKLIAEHTYEEALKLEEYSEIIDSVEIEEQRINRMIREYVEEHDEDLLKDIIKDAIDEEYLVQEFVEQQICEYDDTDYNPEYFNGLNENDFHYYDDYPAEKDPFDSIDGNVDYMSMGIWEGEKRDHFEEPPSYEPDYVEVPYFDEPEYIDDYGQVSEPDFDENSDDNHIENLIVAKIEDEKLLEKAFLEYIKEEERLENIIRHQIANNEKLNEKIESRLKDEH